MLSVDLMADPLYEELVSRGFVHTVTNADGFGAALARQQTFYVGFDPTAKSPVSYTHLTLPTILLV